MWLIVSTGHTGFPVAYYWTDHYSRKFEIQNLQRLVLQNFTRLHATCVCCFLLSLLQLNLSPWPESANDLYRLSDRRLSAKLVPTFTDRVCRVVSVTDLNCRILGFLERGLYFLLQIAPQLYSRGWVDPVPDPLLLRKSGSPGNRTRTSGSVANNSDQ
jgi:hypothetical protein